MLLTPGEYRSAECAIFIDKHCKNVSRKQMKFYLDAEQRPWIVNVGHGGAECLVSGERCLLGEPLRLKPGDILEVSAPTLIEHLVYIISL